MALRRRARATPAGASTLFPGFGEVVEIGIGSLATVYRAREPDTGRLVALKLLNVRDASPRAVESFERESTALGALGAHPNIVTLYRTFRTADGRPVLVLELCSGAVSDRLLGGVGLPVRDAVSIGIKIAGALETAHRGGVLHRDVKPQNILVTEFGEPALADFGVAMLQSSTQTTAGLFDFTTLHAAPELLEGGGTSAATDVYELASSLYQLTAGRSAFRAYDGESPASVILRILRDPVRPLLGAGVPVALSDLLIRAMSKDKEQRPPTAAEFAAELAAVEIAQGWPRTQFLVRGAVRAQTGWVPEVVRLPDALPRRQPTAPQPPPPAYAPPSAYAPPLAAGPPAAGPPAAGPPAAGPLPAWSAPGPDRGTGAATAGRAPVIADSVPTPEPIPMPEPEPVPTPDPVPTPGPVPEPIPSVVPEPGAAAPNGRLRVAIDDELDLPFDEAVGRQVPDADATAPITPPSPQAPTSPQAPAAAAPAAVPDRYPVPPAATGDPPPAAASATAAVPRWAVRTPAAQFLGAGPQFVGDIVIDPASLRPKLTVRSGLSSLTVDAGEVRLRRLLSCERMPWSEVLAFEQHFTDAEPGPRTRGMLLAITPAGAVELPATRRLGGELPHLHALLDAYRIRAMLALSA